MTMTGNEDFLTAILRHGNLQVDMSDPNPRPMIAVLDAKPGLAAIEQAAVARWDTWANPEWIGYAARAFHQASPSAARV
jgi:hypothetical protein